MPKIQNGLAIDMEMIGYCHNAEPKVVAMIGIALSRPSCYGVLLTREIGSTVHRVAKKLKNLFFISREHGERTGLEI